MFAGTDRQIDLLWEEDGRGKRITEVRIVGGAWTLENGLKTGLALAEAEKIIGKPVRGMSADGDGGSLATVDSTLTAAGFGLVIRGAPTVQAPTEPRRTAGSKKSGSPAPAPAPVPAGPRPASNAVVTKMVIWFR